MSYNLSGQNGSTLFSILKEFVRAVLTPRYHKKPAAGFIVVKEFPDGIRVLGLKIDGHFDLPKGKKEPGETTFQTAVRECAEESGITDIIFPWGINPIQIRHVTLFIGLTRESPVIKPNPESGRVEHDSAEWLTWDSMINQCKPYLRPAVEVARTIIEDKDRIND